MTEPISSPDLDVQVALEVIAERARQDAKWGEQNHPNGTGPDAALLGTYRYASLRDAAIESTDRRAKLEMLSYADIFLEEVFEAMAEYDPEKLRTELIQCAAVAVAWVEKIDRDTAKAAS